MPTFTSNDNRVYGKAFRSAMMDGMEKQLCDVIAGELSSDLQWLIDWINSEFIPDQIFDHSVLEQWAVENGYVKNE